MPNPVTLITMTGLTIAGASLGIYLGKGAIGEVDPFYYSQQPASHFYADLTPAGYQSAQPTGFAIEDYAVNELNVSGRPECYDCRNFFDERMSREAALPPPQSDSEAEEETFYQTAETVPVQANSVTRYASFPVTAQEVEQQSQTAAPIYAAGTSAQEGGEAVPVGM